jgi:Predicted translation initiation factor 2B subunit, eIF-2B alpha/beta/delta family
MSLQKYTFVFTHSGLYFCYIANKIGTYQQILAKLRNIRFHQMISPVLELLLVERKAGIKAGTIRTFPQLIRVSVPKFKSQELNTVIIEGT